LRTSSVGGPLNLLTPKRIRTAGTETETDPSPKEVWGVRCHPMKLLYKAKSMIERDALRARLHGAAIASDAPERSVSRKVTNETVDLSLGAVSLWFDGFAVLVPEEDMARAQEVLDAFLLEMQATKTPPATHWPRAYSCAIFSILIPVIFNLLAVYHAVRAWRAGEAWPHSRFKAFGAIVVWLMTATVMLLLALNAERSV